MEIKSSWGKTGLIVEGIEIGPKGMYFLSMYQCVPKAWQKRTKKKEYTSKTV